MPDCLQIPKVVEREDLQLDLQFENSHNLRTYLSHQYSKYPFHICRVQYLDDVPSGMGTVYLQSSAGGIFSNDRCVFCVELLRQKGGRNVVSSLKARPLRTSDKEQFT